MTLHSRSLITLTRSAVSASSLCLGLLFACGGTTENGSNDDTMGPTTNGPTTNGPTTNGPTTTGGPTTNGPTTTGGPTTDGSNGGTGGGPNDCPSVEPAEGSSCSDDFQLCAYANCVAPDYRNGHELQCSNGAWWVVSETPCDDVPIECPPNVYLGASCGVPNGTGPCTVYDACGVFREVYCTDGYWAYPSSGGDAAPPPDGFGGGSNAVGTGPSAATITTGFDPIPQCPENAPTQGAPCCPGEHPEYCTYVEYRIDGTAASTQTVVAATGGAFTSATTGSGGSGGIVAPALECASCSADMTWQPSDLCP